MGKFLKPGTRDPHRDQRTLDRRNGTYSTTLEQYAAISPEGLLVGIYPILPSNITPNTVVLGEPLTQGQEPLPVEHLVLMYQIPPHDVLAEKIKRNRCILDELGDGIASMHTKIVSLTGEEAKIYGSVDHVLGKISKNAIKFLETVSLLGFDQPQSLLDWTQTHTDSLWSVLDKLAKSEQFKKILNSRIEEGFIKQTHGDLTLSNLGFTDRHFKHVIRKWYEAIIAFDPIDFEKSFAVQDIFADALMLAVDLEGRMSNAEYRVFINHYLNANTQYSEDIHLLELIYKLDKAMTRAAIEGLLNRNKKLSERFTEITKLTLEDLYHLPIFKMI